MHRNPSELVVVGFPKSGNTWLARLLAEATKSTIAGYDPINTADNFRGGREKGFIVRKEHVVSGGVASIYGPTVYIVRDIRDVVISGFFFNNRWARKIDVVKNRVVRPYFRQEIRKLNRRWQGDPWSEAVNRTKILFGRKRVPVDVGSWSSHVEHWISQPGITVVRYEDLLVDPHGELGRVSREAGLDVSERELRDAVEAQSFEKKKREFEERGDRRNVEFLRSGQSGDWMKLLDVDLVREIERTHRSVLQRMGYRLQYEIG